MAGQEATKWVGQLNLKTEPPVLDSNFQSLPPITEFIEKVAADVLSFMNKSAS